VIPSSAPPKTNAKVIKLMAMEFIIRLNYSCLLL
jgi:hypothetical protein